MEKQFGHQKEILKEILDVQIPTVNATNNIFFEVVSRGSMLRHITLKNT
jgi:hypothetical protein